jgi:hypothetical protein
MKKFIEPTDEQRRQLLTGYGVPFDRIVREKERREVTAVSRTTAWELEQEQAYPAFFLLAFLLFAALPALYLTLH